MVRDRRWIAPVIAVLAVALITVVVQVGYRFTFGGHAADGGSAVVHRDHVRMQRAYTTQNRLPDSMHWWQVQIRADPDQDRGTCRFFHTFIDVPDTVGAGFVVLADHRIVGIDLDGPAGAAAILHECGTGAPARWWIDALWWTNPVTPVTETVLDSPAPPRLTTTPTHTDLVYFINPRDVDSGPISFHSNLPPGTYRVQATLTADGRLTITRTPLPTTTPGPPTTTR